MNIDNFFKNVVKMLKLGNILEKPMQITGGFTHRMFKIVTSKGPYIVKLLNPNIMKRITAMSNFKNADVLEEIIINNNIPVIASLKLNGKKMQEYEGQYFYIFNWYDGKSLKNSEIKQNHCEKIGRILSDIHNIDLKEEKFVRDEIHIDWNYYISLAKEKESPIYEMLKDKENILNDSMNKGNIAIKNVPDIISICHNDMDSKNVLWINDDFKLIDLECLGYSNPYLEMFELALCWSGYETCNINFKLFKTFFETYFKNTKLNININWEDIYYSNFGKIKWLEFNIKRSLMIECNTLEEQNIGVNEVKETIRHILYYNKIKNEILKNINFFI